ncbi:hypothetical protein [Lacinutrix chionoecetis]
MTKSILRKDLYNQVWSLPLNKLAPKFGLTPTLLKTICVKNNIPLPEVGHWIKLKHSVDKPPKPLPSPDENNLINFNLYTIGIPDSPQSRLAKLKREILNDKNLDFTVPARLVKPDPLIVAVKTGLENFQKERYYTKGTIVFARGETVSIAVAKEHISRALRFMDTFIKLVKKRGHTIEVDSTTKIIVNGQKIEVRFREILKRKTHPEYSWITSMPSGILSFRFDSKGHSEWRDSQKRPLEQRLPEILAKLEYVSEELIAYQIYLEKGWEKQRILREKEQKIKAKRDKEISDFKALINNSGRWQKSESLRRYLKEYETRLKEEDNLSSEAVEWLSWAKKKADWYDPFIESEDETFRGLDRDEF